MRIAYQHFLRAREAIARRDLPAAVDGFQKALAACPGDPMIARLLDKTRRAHSRLAAQGAGIPPPEPAARPSATPGPGPVAGPPVARRVAPRARPGPAPPDPARFLSALGSAPAPGPALNLDMTGSDSFKELIVSLGILALLVAFGFLLIG